MVDDGKCYSCNERKDIEVSCIGKEKAFKICPHRNFHEECGAVSKYCFENNCPKGTFMGDDGTCYDCTKDDEIPVNCMGEELIFSTCPNRAIRYSGGVLMSYVCHKNYNKIINRRCCKDNECIGDTIIYY